MKINRTKEGINYLNEDNVIVKTYWNESYVERGDGHAGVGDSLGRNAYALFAFKEDKEDIIKVLK